MADLEAAVQHMINLCNDDSHGYDWANRWGPDYDCSSSIITALRTGGFDTGSANTTRDMSSELCARGWVRLPPNVEKQRGDICLNDENHVEMYIGDGLLAGFHSNEFGGVYGGQPGDQTGNEGSIGAYYDYPWNCVLRWPEGIKKKLTLVRWIPK
ncbi:peptidoglycan amidohydrolase family protein [Lachnospiraceae bacterium 42-17]